MPKYYIQIANFAGNPVDLKSGSYPSALIASQAITIQIIEDIHEITIRSTDYSGDYSQADMKILVRNAIILAKKAADNLGAEQLCEEQRLWATMIEV